MNQDFSNFWHFYITVIVLLSVIGCGVFLWVQDKAKKTPGQTTGHVWDETLEEYDNPLPNWWRWLFYLTVVFSLAYVVLYPGLGHYEGVFKWTQHNQYEREMAHARQTYDPVFDAFLKQDLVSLSQDPKAREMGKTLFLTYCAQCHGSDAQGARGFPNLTDKDWLYGGTPEVIEESILDGRHGTMPPYGGNPDAVGGPSGAREVAHYVRRLAGLAHDDILATNGKERFEKVCAVCHGIEGKGNRAMGAPDLTDKVWLYGSREAVIVDTIIKGRSNEMPAHRERLGAAKVHLLAAYVYGLGGGEAPAANAEAGTSSAPAVGDNSDAAAPLE